MEGILKIAQFITTSKEGFKIKVNNGRVHKRIPEGAICGFIMK